jgi:uncharacterized protein YndB with AHSA1/START domain
MLPGDVVAIEVELDLRIGGSLRLVMRGEKSDHVITGEYREISPPHRLAFTWASDVTKNVATLVSLELHEHADGTALTLTHERLPDDESAARHRGGWTSIVEKLATQLTTRPDSRGVG